MPGCIFRASGQNFAVDEFLTATSLKPYQVWRAGEARPRGGVHDDSGFKINVSDIDGELSGQSKDAIVFLHHNQSELDRLATFPSVDDRRLDFGYNRRDVVVQYDYLPPKLLALAGALGIGIELSLYPSGD